MMIIISLLRIRIRNKIIRRRKIQMRIRMRINIYMIEINKINLVHLRSRAPAWILSLIKNKNFKTISTFHNVYSGNSYFKKIYNKQLSKVDQIVAISDYVKNEIIKKYNLNSNKITVINRGVDVDYFDKEILDDEIENSINKFQIDT